MNIRFEWDEGKAVANYIKHGVSFDEAATIFADTASITIYDEAHSIDEDRFIDIGVSINHRLLVVVYTERNERTRLITARPATSKERRQYEQRDTA